MTRIHFILALSLAAPLIAVPAPVQSKPAEPENALKYLEAAREAYKPHPGLAPTPEQQARAVEDNAAVFPLLERAVQLPLRFERKPLTRADDIGGSSKLNAAVRHQARLLALRGVVRERAGDIEGAAQSDLLAVALGIKMQEDGTIIASLVGYAVEGIGWSALQKLAPRLDARTLKATARRLGELEAGRGRFDRVLRDDRDESLDMVRFMFQQPEYRPVLDEAAQKILLEALQQQMEQDDEALTRPFPLLRGLDWHELEDQDDEQEPTPPAPGPDFEARAQVWARAWAKQTRPNVTRLRILFLRTRAQAQLALLGAALATRAYKLEHGAFPASLQILVPEYLAAPPADPFEIGAPLRFENDARGLRLYSIGPDGLDDNGLAIAEPNIAVDSVGDIAAPPELLKP